MLSVRSKIDCAAEDIKQTAIYWFACLSAKSCVEFLRVLAPKLGGRSESQIPEIEGDTVADPGDLLELIENLTLLMRNHCVCQLRSRFLQHLMSKTADNMVIDHPCGLHESIANGRSNKIEPALPEVFTHGA